MTTPTRIIVDLTTGIIIEVKLSGDELAFYEASLAAQIIEQQNALQETVAASYTQT